MHPWRGVIGGEFRGGGYSAPNAPEGVVIDYFLKSEIPVRREQREGREPPPGRETQVRRETPVEIVITDSLGNPVATQYGPSKAGVNRFVWNMRYDPAERLRFEREPEPGAEVGGAFERNRAPNVLAGTYHVKVTVSGHTEEGTASVNPDPTLKIDPAEFRTQLQAALEARNGVSALNEMLDRVDSMQRTLTDFQRSINTSNDAELKKKYEAVLRRGRDLGARLRAIKDSVYNSEAQSGVAEDRIHYLARFHNRITGLAGRIASAYGEAPNALVRDELSELMKNLSQHLDEFNKFITTDVAAYNKEAYSSGAPTLYAGDPISVKKVAGI
jgi:hypothetical protein